MRVGPARRKKSVAHLFIPERGIESEHVLRRFDPFLLDVPCQARGQRGGTCGGRYGVYSGDGSTHCQRCGFTVPAPRRSSFQIGEL